MSPKALAVPCVLAGLVWSFFAELMSERGWGLTLALLSLAVVILIWHWRTR